MNQSSTALIPLLLSQPDYPASAHARDNHGDTPLHHASAAGSLKALRILLSAGADPMAKNAYDWSPLAYSQNVVAEVHFKNLVAELERAKIEGARGEREKKEEQMRRKGAGVRLVTGDDDTVMRPSIDTVRSDSITWSPIEKQLTTATYTPNLGKGGHWSDLLGGTRARASSGD